MSVARYQVVRVTPELDEIELIDSGDELEIAEDAFACAVGSFCRDDVYLVDVETQDLVRFVLASDE